MRRSLLILLALALATPASAQVVGRAAALGSDTLMLNGQAFRLFGIEGIEFHQFCFVDGEPWACGASATRAFQSLVEPVVITCNPTGETAGDAALAICSSEDGDLAQFMVEQGWALADRLQSEDYVAAEEEARSAGNGVWRGAVLEPWTFRDEMAAIARRYGELVTPLLRADAEAALTADGARVDVFADVPIATAGPADGAATAAQEVTLPGVGDDFLTQAIPPRDVFNWDIVIDALSAWRQNTVAAVRNNMIDAVKASLLAHPAEVRDVEDADGYFAAMNAAAAAWIAEGRQPILIISGPDTPRWVGEWLSGQMPLGGSRSHRDDIDAPNYLGTINGIDIYASGTPAMTSLLTVADLLQSIVFRTDADGMALQVTDNEAAGTMTFNYALAIEWKDDPVVWIQYPPAEGANPYAN